MIKRCALFILALTAIAGTLACGFIGGSPPEGPAELVPDGARELVLVDVSESALSRTDLPIGLEGGVSTLENYGDVRQQAAMSLASGQVTVTSGDFDFEDIRRFLQEGGYIEAAYRGYDFWESANGSEASALLKEDGFLISGDFEAVIDVLRDLNRDSGLLWNDDEGELNQVMNLAGDGLVTLVTSAGRDCRLADNTGCRAVAWAFTRREERRTVIEGTAALLFRDASAAASAAPLIEQAINANELMALTEIVNTGATITVRADIDRDDFAKLEVPVRLGR